MLTYRGRDSNDRYQEKINAFFEKTGAYWIGIYQNKGVQELIHQQRLQLLLDLVDRINPPPDSHALEIGCGAGHAAIGIAKRGYFVEAIDPVQTMVDSTRDLAKQADVDGRVRTNLGDVHALRYATGTFALVVALGVLPWLPSIEQPVREMCRVLEPGGHLIATIDNRWALRWLLEPRTSSLLMPAKKVIRKLIPRSGVRGPQLQSFLTSIWRFDALLNANGLEKLEAITLGFGPFTIFQRRLLPDRVAISMHSALQRLARGRWAPLRLLGSQYVVLARKRGATKGALGVPVA
jgi:SAM-dependent methyltransferase